MLTASDQSLTNKAPTGEQRGKTMIKNINDEYGMPEIFESVEEMAQAISECMFDLPADGLKEGRDYEVVNQPETEKQC